MIWLISANSNLYKHDRSFQDCGYIDWKQGITKYSVGDSVYIYVARPEKKIKYKCVVEKIKLTAKDIKNDKEYWVNEKDYFNSLDGFFVRFRLQEKSNSNLLILDKLLKNGLKNAPQSPKKLDGELLYYIENNFELSFYNMIDEECSEVAKSLVIDSNIRNRRISTAPKFPPKKAVTIYVYERSADIIAEALIRANGICEKCHLLAPFKRKSDKTPYLEVHHKIRLADGGDDSMNNVIALCPNCHRKIHYGI